VNRLCNRISFFLSSSYLLLCSGLLSAQTSSYFHLIPIDTLKSFLTYETREFKIESVNSSYPSYRIQTSEEIAVLNLGDTLYLIPTKAGDYHLQLIADTSHKILFDTSLQVSNNPLVNPEWSTASVTHFPGTRSWEEARVFSNFVNYKLLNEPFPFVNMLTANGDTFSNQLFRNKITVLNFWYYGCLGCIVELPALNELCRSFSGNPSLQFCSFFNDSVIRRGDSLFFSTRITSSEGKVYPRFYDACYQQIPLADSFSNKLPVFTYPSNMIIDCSGIVRFIVIGGHKNSKEWVKMMKERIEQQVEICEGDMK
jgi:hypothetical protein